MAEAGSERVRAVREPPLPAGTLDENLNVICGSGLLEIKKIKPAGSVLMDFRDFVNGRQTQPGDRFSSLVTRDNEKSNIKM
jgi:methionyl-tRNA formyltransferase